MASGVIGQAFDPYVQGQIQIRQEKLGTNNRSEDVLKYMNSKTPWLKLTSGIDVDATRLAEVFSNSSYSYGSGANLAKEFQLFGAQFNGGKTITKGVGYNDNSSYGFLSDSDYGHVPPPGIISADIKSVNRGSLRFADIKIICHNLQQFKVIETLYLRLKYSMLLEWGHSIFFDNSGNLLENTSYSISDDFLAGSTTLNGVSVNLNENVVLTKIREQRRQSDGNYDGFYGFVKNFSWTLRQDGGYDITLNLVSAGDVIESLKINTNYPKVQAAITSGSNDPTYYTNQNKSTLNTILNYFSNQLWSGGGSGAGSVKIIDGIPPNGPANTDQISANTGFSTNFKRDTGLPFYSILEGLGAGFPNLQQGTWYGAQYYVKLGTLLKVIESYLLYYDTNKNAIPLVDKGEGYPPIIGIDWDFYHNYCFTIPNQCSTDPTVCLIPLDTVSAASTPQYRETHVTTTYKTPPLANVVNTTTFDILGLPTVLDTYINGVFGTIYGVVNGATYTTSDNTVAGERTVSTVTFTFLGGGGVPPLSSGIYYYLDQTDKDGFRSTKSAYVGFTMGILLNIDYIARVLENFIDAETGAVSLYEFLSNLMKGVQAALGNINNFEVIYDEDTNLLKIIDNTNIPELFKVSGVTPGVVTPINPNLLYSNYGSFVKDLVIKTEFSNAFATMVSIGAQANGNVVGEDSTAFSKWNTGLKDRIVPTKTNLNSKPSTAPDVETLYINNLAALRKFNKSVNDGVVSDADISAISYTTADIYSYDIGHLVNKNYIPPRGFIPLDMQITLDGISGPRLLEVYTINETLLPENYRKHLQFLVKGISHKIDINGWTTTLNSLGTPIDKNLSVKQPPKPTQLSSGGNSGGNGGGNGGTGYWATKLRTALAAAGGGSGANYDTRADITENMYKAAAKVFELIHTNFPTFKIESNSGNDTFHNAPHHSTGNAIDFSVTNPSAPRNGFTWTSADGSKTKQVQFTQADVDSIISKVLDPLTAGNNNFRYLNEYNFPSTGATGPHFHISWSSGGEGGNNQAAAKRKVTAGTLTAITI
jgi:hypothetical protein